MAHTALTADSLAQLFTQARTHSHWLKQPVSAETLKALYELWQFGPTSANCSPARIVFVQSADAKEKLRPALAAGNFEKTMNAPVTAIVGMDMMFYDKLPQLFPHADARSWFAGNEAAIQTTAFRNSSLQGAYLMLAARALGLDCGPMSGFDAAHVEAAFFPQGNIKVNFLCNLGYGDASKLHARLPKLAFEEVCQIA